MKQFGRSPIVASASVLDAVAISQGKSRTTSTSTSPEGPGRIIINSNNNNNFPRLPDALFGSSGLLYFVHVMGTEYREYGNR